MRGTRHMVWIKTGDCTKKGLSIMKKLEKMATRLGDQSKCDPRMKCDLPVGRSPPSEFAPARPSRKCCRTLSSWRCRRSCAGLWITYVEVIFESSGYFFKKRTGRLMLASLLHCPHKQLFGNLLQR